MARAKKHTKAAWAALYPEANVVYQTSDGLVHIEEAQAMAQAQHLNDPTITLIKNANHAPNP
jgi:hypothetical protein